MKQILLKFFLVSLICVLFSIKKASAASVVFTGLSGSSPAYLTQGATNDVVYGFSIFVPASGTFNPGPVHIAGTNSANGFLTGNLIRTTAATPSLAISAPQASYGASFNGTVDINGFPALTGAAGTGTTYYFYLVVSVTVTANPPPASLVFSLPASGSVSQNGYSGGITINNLGSPTTYYFGVNPPTVPAASNCGPGTVTFTASDASPAGGVYAWYAAATGGLPIATGANYAPTISATTTYYVSYTYGLNTSTRTAAIATINPVPVATFTSTASIIAGNSPAVTYTGSDPATSTYAWSFTGGTPATRTGQAPAAVVYSTPGSYSITLNLTNSSGCTATSSNTITVTPAAPTASAVTQCGAGASLTATDITAGGTYNWYTVATGGTAIQSSASPTLANIQSTATYYVSYTYGGLTSARTAVTATINPVISAPYSGATFSYPFNGNTNDISGNGNNGLATGTPALTTDRFGAASSAYNFNGSSQYISTTIVNNNPNVFTISLWFNTTTAGGKLIGLGASQTGTSSNYDRHIYMSNTGQLYYGIDQSGSVLTINTAASYNDGNWHHVIVTMGSDGSTMYVDGVMQAANASMTTGQNFTPGYWRIGYDNLAAWTAAPTNYYFTGKLDDIAVYNRELSSAEIASSNNLNQIGFPNTAQCLGSPISFSAPTITGATYTWTDAAANTKTGQNVTFSTGTAGNYTLTVTGGPGACSSSAIVTPLFFAAPSAAFTAPATVAPGGSPAITYTGTDPVTSTYAWTFTGGFPATGSGQTPPVVTYATPGTYTISLTVTNANGCIATSSKSISVAVAAPTAAAVTQCGAGATLTAAGGVPAGGNYNWYTAATGGTAFQSSTSATLANIQSTATYYVSYTTGGNESARTAVTATINPIVSAPYSGSFFSYPFSGNTNDVSSYGNNGSNNGASLTTDRYGAANAAYSFNGSSNYMTDPFIDNNPTSYTISIWFNTTTTTGGALIGLENGSFSADRLLYMSNSGQVYWGLKPGTVQTINTALSYNDGNWHHVIVTVSSAGSTLYVDGTALATSTAMTAGNNLDGYWTMAYGLLSGWANAPSSDYFLGKLDDIAVYHRVLASTEIATSNDINQIYVGAATTCSALTFNAPTITGATYTWTDPNNATQTGQSVSFPGAVAGNYTLTVTSGPGGCSSTAVITPTIYTSTAAAFNVPASIPLNTNTTVSLYSPVGSSTYSWNFGGGTSSSGTTGQGPFSVQWSTSGIKTITLTVTTSGGCVTTTTKTIKVTATTYGSYTYSRTITLNNAAAGITTNLSNFPVLLTIQSNDLVISGTCNDKIQNPTGNYDFAFFDPSAPSELYYQVESYNSTTGTLMVWVRIPTLYAATNNTLTFYYGAKIPSVIHNAAFFANTWNADYQAVYHFNEAALSPTTADGTANGRTATLSGFQSTDYVAAGKIGSCYTFGGTSGSPTANDMEAPAISPSSTFTLSAWVNTSNNNIDEKVLTDQNGSGTASGGFKLGVYYGSAETEADYYINRSSNTPAEPTPLTNGTWYYVQGVYDGTTMSTYVNGVQYKKYAVTSTSTFTNTLFIGIGEAKLYPFSGMIDEPRVSNVAKSSDWIKMEYVNQNNPSAFIISTSAASCSVANGSSIIGELSYTWNGSTSTDPSVAANWTNTISGTAGQLPAFDGSASLVIPSGLTKYPALTAAASVYGLTIANGAYLNLNGNVLSVGCHIYNGSGGQILYGSSTTSGGITFNGSLPTQYYYGTTTGVANVANLTVNNSAGGTVDITGGAFGVNNMLTLTNGNLLIDNTGSGSLTLLSSATNSGSVAAIPTGSNITGNVNVQRYITSGTGSRGYRLLSSPVNINSSTAGTGNLSLSYLNANVPFGSANYYGALTAGPGTGFTINGTNNPIIYVYDESRPTNNTTFTSGKNVGIYSISSGTVTTINGVPATTSAGVSIPVGNSYLFYYVGSDQSTVVSSSRVPDATTLTATGYLNQGTVPVTFWKTGSTAIPYDVTSGTTNYGLNQVGNPYASTISLNTLYTDNYNSGTNPIGAAFYELIPGGNYVTYNAANGHVSDSRASQYIVSGQGFLVQATGASPAETLTFQEDQKVAYNSSPVLLETFPSRPKFADAHIKTNAIINPVMIPTTDSTGLHLQLTLDSANFAQTGIYFSTTASDKYQQPEDAVQIDGGTPQVFLSSYSSDSVKLSINTLADYTYGKRVRLYASAVNSGVYALSLANIAQMDTADYRIYLVDNLQKDSLDLVHYKTYTFNINTADTTTYGSNRFVLAIDHASVPQYVLSTFSGQKVSTGVQLNWTAVNAGNYIGYTLQKLNPNGGYDSLYAVQSDTSITKYSFIDTHPVMGNNTYRLAQNGMTSAITYSANVTVGYNSTTPNGALTLYPNPASSIIHVNMTSSTINTPTYVVNIFNSMGVLMKNESINGGSWTDDVSSYKLGIYVMQIKDTNGNILGQAKFAKVN
jgi:hypothetical protein